MSDIVLSCDPTYMRRCTWLVSVSSLFVSMCTAFWSDLAVYRKHSDIQGHLQDTTKQPIKHVHNTHRPQSSQTSQQADFLVKSWEQGTGWTLTPSTHVIFSCGLSRPSWQEAGVLCCVVISCDRKCFEFYHHTLIVSSGLSPWLEQDIAEVLPFSPLNFLTIKL